MAVDTAQGEQSANWVRAIRPILMEELGMSIEMVYRADIVSELASRLNEIKWGGSQTTLTAIGQSITLTTPIAIARYVAAVINGGYVYDVTLVDSVLSSTGDVIKANDPVLVSDLSAEIGPYVDYIKKGMKNVVADETGTASRYFTNWDYVDMIGGKTGTAEKSKLDVENNAWFISFAPYDEPEIVVVVYVPYGMSAGLTTQAARTIYNYYLGSKVETDTVQAALPVPNTLAP
jgi:penicillin-binding protein 2